MEKNHVFCRKLHSNVLNDSALMLAMLKATRTHRLMRPTLLRGKSRANGTEEGERHGKRESQSGKREKGVEGKEEC